jgi:hypothetical protein
MENVFKEAILKRFYTYQELGEKALQQLDDAQIHWKRVPGDNTAAVIVRHMHGNMLSRFTDFRHSDGEKPWRDRDQEFLEDIKMDQPALLALWREGWTCVLEAVAALDDSAMDEQVRIRDERHTVADALLRQVAHYAYHVGQLVFLAKSILGDKWQSLSIAPGASAAFNEVMKRRHGNEPGNTSC